MSNNVRTLYLVMVIALTLIAMTGIIGKTINDRTRIFVENGYTLKSLPGNGFAQWVKEYPNDKK